jgi:hypothetical protein
MNILGNRKKILKNEKKNTTKISKFFSDKEINMTVLNSIILLVIFLIVTILILISKDAYVRIQ